MKTKHIKKSSSAVILPLTNMFCANRRGFNSILSLRDEKTLEMWQTTGKFIMMSNLHIFDDLSALNDEHEHVLVIVHKI